MLRIEQVSEMKQTKIFAAVLSTALAATLAACGGGGDAEAGSPTPFGITPAERTVTTLAQSVGGPATGRCSPGYSGDVLIVGGTAPYRLINLSPSLVLLHRSSTDFTEVSTVSDRNGTFSVSVAATCFDAVLVTIADKLDNHVELTVHHTPAGPAPAASAASSP